jgi:hypothetical protein
MLRRAQSGTDPIEYELESIRAFAEEHWQRAVIAPGEEHLLKDIQIDHYDVLPGASSRLLLDAASRARRDSGRANGGEWSAGKSH